MSRERVVVAVSDLKELREFVHRTLCEHDRLDPEQTPMFSGTIKRAGKPCGLFFQIEGPRLLKTYAVWAGDEDRILFYDSAGLRFAEAKVCEGPDPLDLAA
jgi:hypothetical protein